MQTGVDEQTQLERLVPELERLRFLVTSNDAERAARLHNLVPDLELIKSHIDADAMALVKLLNDLVPDLIGLKTALSSQALDQKRALERLVADNNLERLGGMKSEFDALMFLGELLPGVSGNWWRSEEFHSNFLAWLLTPTEEHNIGTHFVKNFLIQSGAPRAFCTLDWSSSIVHREWHHEVDGQIGYLDILVLNEAEHVLCAVENKVFSHEHSHQLTRYRRALANEYRDFARHLVFLTREGISPSSEGEQLHWQPVGYSRVVDAVERTVAGHPPMTSENVLAFLKQYTTTLRRNIVPDSNTNIRELVREIYLKHREAIDLIIEHMPNFAEETKDVFKQTIEYQPNWVFDSETGSIVRFRSTDWDQFQVFTTGTGWGASKSLLLFEFQIGRDAGPRLVLMLGPSSAGNVRAKIHAEVLQRPDVFKDPNPSFTQSWTRLDRSEVIVTSSHFEITDNPTIQSNIFDWVQNFAENEFPAMNEVIVNCLREYEAETKDQ